MAAPKQAPQADKALVKAGEDADADTPKREGWLSWIVGWILMPTAVVGVIFGAGVLLGAHMHDSWYARTVEWVVGIFN